MTKRTRGQNEASIYKRKSDSRWCGAVSVGGGKRKYAYGKTRADVARKIDAIRASLSQGIQPADERITVEDVIGQWLNVKRQTVRPKTAAGYADLMRVHVIPSLGSYKLPKLSPADLERLYADRLKVISPQTVRNVHIVLSQVLSWAVRREMIGRNPAQLIAAEDLPKVIKKPPTVLSPEQARKLIDVAAGTRSETLIALALTTGARLGELTGLTWDRVELPDERNLDKPATVRIDRALQFEDGKPVHVETKTAASRRTLTLTNIALVSLRQHRLEQNETALRLGKKWGNDLDLVFTNEIGKALNRNVVLRRYFRPLLRAACLPVTMRFHDLRHAAASLLLADGLPIPLVSEMLGHANPSITMSVYSHALPNSQHVAASAMDALLGNRQQV